MGSTSFQIRKKLQKLFTDKLLSRTLKIVFTLPVRMKSFFTFNDKIPKMLLSGLIYKYKCSNCNATYYGKTKHHFKVWICNNLGISQLIGKKVKIDKTGWPAKENSKIQSFFNKTNSFSTLKKAK